MHLNLAYIYICKEYSFNTRDVEKKFWRQYLIYIYLQKDLQPKIGILRFQ